MKSIAIILCMASLAGAVENPWSVTIAGNPENDIVLGAGYNTEAFQVGLGVGIWRQDDVSPGTDVTIGPYITFPFDVPGKPFGGDLSTFVGISPQWDCETREPLLELFAGAKIYADKQVSPIVGAKYDWLTKETRTGTDINDGFMLFGGVQIRF